MVLAEIPHIDDPITTRQAFDLEVIRVAFEEQEPGRSAAAVRLELVAIHLSDGTWPVRHLRPAT